MAELHHVLEAEIASLLGSHVVLKIPVLRSLHEKDGPHARNFLERPSADILYLPGDGLQLDDVGMVTDSRLAQCHDLGRDVAVDVFDPLAQAACGEPGANAL